MAAVQYVHYPHYRALILRKTYADLSLPDAIRDRAISCWDGVEGARFNNQEKACYFPSGAKITFGYLASVRDHLRYQGAAVHFVGIDEASQIPSRQLEYLHSRIRRSAGDPIPLRYRLASNPGDVSHDWLKDTYVNGADGHSIVYLPGLMTDNPGLDVDEYRKQLIHLDPVTRKQLEEGDWDVQLSGGVLDVTKLKYFTSGEFGQRVRYWDLAATVQKDTDDPDWTARSPRNPAHRQWPAAHLQDPLPFFPLLLIILSLLLVAVCVQPSRVTLSIHRYSPVSSRASLTKLKTIRACSMLPAHWTISLPSTNRSSPGVSALVTMWAARNDFPFPRGRDKAAMSIPGANARRINSC